MTLPGSINREYDYERFRPFTHPPALWARTADAPAGPHPTSTARGPPTRRSRRAKISPQRTAMPTARLYGGVRRVSSVHSPHPPPVGCYTDKSPPRTWDCRWRTASRGPDSSRPRGRRATSRTACGTSSQPPRLYCRRYGWWLWDSLLFWGY
jgi:hypothetical protein